MAVRHKKCARDFRNQLQLVVRVRRIQQFISKTSYVKYMKAKKATIFQRKQKDELLNWARQIFYWNATDWKTVVFTNVKSLTWTYPRGFNYHWHDSHKEPDIFSSDSK